MYPSDEDPLFGIFVKNSTSEMENQGVQFSRKIFIRGKSPSSFIKGIRYLIHYFRIIRSFLFGRHDLVYVHYLSHHLPVLIPLLPFKRKPLVINVHGSDITSVDGKPLLKKATSNAIGGCELLIVPTTYFKRIVLEKYPNCSPDQIFISPSGGIDSARFFRKERPSNGGQISIGFVSRFIEEKGWRTFLEATLQLKEIGIPFSCLIAGKGPDEDAIKSFIQKNKLTDVIQFIGFVPQDRLADIYNKLDVYVFPTYRAAESLGLTGIEAMSCGVPVIGCNIAGPGTYIKDGYNGYFFPARNGAGLAAKILEFYGLSPEAKETFSQNAIRTAAEYDQKYVTKMLIRKLEELIK